MQQRERLFEVLPERLQFHRNAFPEKPLIDHLPGNQIAGVRLGTDNLEGRVGMQFPNLFHCLPTESRVFLLIVSRYKVEILESIADVQIWRIKRIEIPPDTTLRADQP